MDDILKQKVTAKLRAFLNREPSADEITNGQTDATLMGWIARDDAASQKQQIDAIAVATNVDLKTISNVTP